MSTRKLSDKPAQRYNKAPRHQTPGQAACKMRATRCTQLSKPKPGGHSPMAPPGPIPNPEVKHWHVDDSRTTGPAKVDSCQDQRSPSAQNADGLLFFCTRGNTPPPRPPLMRLIRARPPASPHPPQPSCSGRVPDGTRLTALRALGRLVGQQVPRK